MIKTNRISASTSTQKYYRFLMILGCGLFFNSWIASYSMAAKDVTCPPEVKAGEEFPMKDSNNVTWHDSNSINMNIDHKAICSWKTVTPSKRKEGHVCTYSDFSECSVEGTPAGTVLYLTDYKPKVKAAKKAKH